MQDLCKLPKEYSVAYQMGAYDRCVIKYRENYYSLHMPCIPLAIEKEGIEELDDKDIITWQVWL